MTSSAPPTHVDTTGSRSRWAIRETRSNDLGVTDADPTPARPRARSLEA